MPVGKVYQAPPAAAAAVSTATLAPKLMHNPFLEQDAKRVNGAAPVKRNFVVPPKKTPNENGNGNLQVIKGLTSFTLLPWSQHITWHETYRCCIFGSNSVNELFR